MSSEHERMKPSTRDRSRLATAVRRHPVAFAGGTLAAAAAGSWIAGSLAVRVGRLAFAPPADARLGGEAVVIDADPSRVAATYWPGANPRSPALLLVPGLATLHRTLAVNAAWLAAQGYAVLAIDMRGHGASSPALHSFGWSESLDVHAAHSWLKGKQGGAKVAVLGISMGGAAALIGPKGPVPADAFVLQAVFADLRSAVRCRIRLVLGRGPAWVIEPLLSFQSWLRLGVPPSAIAPLAAMPTLRRPVLVIGGARLVRAAGGNLRLLRRGAGRAGDLARAEARPHRHLGGDERRLSSARPRLPVRGDRYIRRTDARRHAGGVPLASRTTPAR